MMNRKGRDARVTGARRAGLSTGLLLLAAAATHGAAWGLSCSTQSALPAAERDAIVTAARTIGTAAIEGQAAAVKSDTTAAVAAQFDAIAATLADLAPRTKGATLTVESVYALHAMDLKPSTAGASAEAQFFCSVAGSDLLVTITIPDLPPGEYAVAVMHATGVAHPQQFALIVERDAGTWKLAGFSAKPLTEAGHDGLWYWTQARAYARKQERWSAFFYYQTAEYLLNPADFLASPNLAKLEREASAARPEGLPGEQPMTLAAGDTVYTITGLRTDGSFAEAQGATGGLDLVVQEKVASVADPVAARAAILALMQALLAQHPELRSSFHGLWVYADAPGSQPFAIELPMAQIPAG